MVLPPSGLRSAEDEDDVAARWPWDLVSISPAQPVSAENDEIGGEIGLVGSLDSESMPVFNGRKGGHHPCAVRTCSSIDHTTTVSTGRHDVWICNIFNCWG